MRNTKTFPVFITVALLAIPIAASANTLVLFDPPGSTATLPAAINKSGQITGYYQQSGSNWRGFLRNTDGTFAPFDPPGSTFTQPTAINNNGMITGQWATSLSGNSQGFVRDASGAITVFNYPGASATQPFSINTGGSIVGPYSAGNTIGSFLRDPSGKFTNIAVPHATSTVALAINDAGQILGYYDSPDSSSHGFLRDASGNYTTFDAPGASMGAYPKAMNNRGIVTGFYFDSNYGGHGYVRDTTGGFTTFDAPKAAPGAGGFVNAGTFPFSVNDAGELVGWVAAKNSVILTFARSAAGVIRELGANDSLNFHQPSAVGVNDSGEIIGNYLPSGNAFDFHGFLVTR
jgi:hypothetical protein